MPLEYIVTIWTNQIMFPSSVKEVVWWLRFIATTAKQSFSFMAAAWTDSSLSCDEFCLLLKNYYICTIVVWKLSC